MKPLRLLHRPGRRLGPLPGATPPGRTQILHAWAELSLHAGWRDAGDWEIPQVNLTVAAGTTAGESLDEAARELGAARFYQGVGVTETMSDWNCFLQATGRALDLGSLQAAVRGWVEASERAEPLACTDPVTGLRTVQHVEELLRTIYAVPSTQEQYSTAVLRFPPGISGPWTEPGWPTAARIGRELNGLVSAANAAGCFRAPTMLVLFRTGPDTALMLRHFHRRCLALLGGAPVDLEMAPLPLKQPRLADILNAQA